jgi:deoxyribonuclease-4
MEQIRKTSQELDVKLTVHAPYFINLNADDPSKLEASKQRILNALSMAELCGAVSVCVHPAFYLKNTPEEAFESVRTATAEIMSFKDSLFPNTNLAYETMGKRTQFGTLEEVLKISKEFGIYPCVDFAHLHARSNGELNSVDEWDEMLDMYKEYLGDNSLSEMHIHYSGIEYTEKGERRHLPLKDSDANWQDFVQVLKERKVGGVLVCESPVMEQDTLLMIEEYDK